MSGFLTYLNPLNVYYGYGPTEDFKYINEKYHLKGIDNTQQKRLIAINNITCIYTFDIDNPEIKIITNNKDEYTFDGISNIHRLLYDIQRYHMPKSIYMIKNIFNEYTKKIKKPINSELNSEFNSEFNSDDEVLNMESINDDTLFEEIEENIEKTKKILYPHLQNNDQNNTFGFFKVKSELVTKHHNIYGFVLNDPDEFISGNDGEIHLSYKNNYYLFTLDHEDPKYKELKKYF